jgi:hypothetical protein
MRPSVYYLYNEASALDAKLCHELENWLYALYRDERQTTRWHKVLPGGELRLERLRQMQQADVILILLSPDFLGQDDCHQRALEALALRPRGTVVIPIVLRPVAGLDRPPMGELQLLPRNGVPISRWRKRDDAWEHVCNEMRTLLERAPKRPLFPFTSEGGATIGQYRIVREAGRGGSSYVFLAEHCMFARPAALKIALPDARAELYMQWEAAMLHAASHPGVIALYDAALLPDGRPYLVLEWLEGQDMGCELQRRSPPADSLGWQFYLRLLGQVAETMAALHARGIVHCDLKPSNIMICGDTAKIIDFTTARLRDTASRAFESPLVREEMIWGTPTYMAPELVMGKDVSDKTDVFSLGAVFFEVCTGRLPFEGSMSLSLMAKVLSERPPSLMSLNPTAPPAVARIVDSMLERKPEDRPTMREVARALGRPR